MERAESNRHSRARMAETAKDASRNPQRRTRRSASTIGGAAPDTIIGRAAAIARERVPTVPLVAKTRRNVPRRIASTAHFERNNVTMICETVHSGSFAEMQSIGPRSGCNPTWVFRSIYDIN